MLCALLRCRIGREVLLLTGACTLFGHLCSARTPSIGRHFLWRVTDAPAPFYLLGSMHALRDFDYPFPAEIEKAIAGSRKVIFERDPNAKDAPLLLRKIRAVTSYPRGATIGQKVSPATFALLKRIARVPLSEYEHQKPWAIAFFMLKAQGMETVRARLGIDRYVFHKIRDRAEIRGLETIDEFVRSLSEMNDSASESFLLQSIDYGERSPELLNETIDAWKSGNTRRMYQLYAPRKNGPAGYWRWIERRDSIWIPRIEDAIESGKPTIVV